MIKSIEHACSKKQCNLWHNIYITSVILLCLTLEYLRKYSVPNIKYSYYTKEWDLEPTPQDIEWYKEYVHDRLGQIRETFERIKY